MARKQPAEPAAPTHIILLAGYGRTYTGRGKGGADILLLGSTPEPIENFDEQEFVEALVESGHVAYCDETGKAISPEAPSGIEAPTDTPAEPTPSET